MKHVNVAQTITQVYSDLMHAGETELAAPLDLIRRRYQKASITDKNRVFKDFLDYCSDYDIIVHMVYEEGVAEGA